MHSPAILTAFLVASVTLSGCLVDDVDFMRPHVDAAVLLEDLQQFAETYSQRRDNHDDHIASRDWLASSFADAGLEVWRQNFTTDIDQQNIVGIKWGRQTDSWVIVGAHYDMVVTSRTGPFEQQVQQRSQGAYDDGSGTLMTVHLAQAWADLDTEHTIAFVAFDGEERGLEGSGAFSEAIVSGHHPYGNVTLRGMLDLDMFGLNWPGVDAPIYFDTNSLDLKNSVETERMAMDMPADMIKYQGISLGRSDYHWFMELGVPTGFFISDFEEWQMPNNIPITTPSSPQAYPFWHLEDTYETMLLMAGSQEDLEAGFDAALRLAGAVLETMALDGEIVAEESD